MDKPQERMKFHLACYDGTVIEWELTEDETARFHSLKERLDEMADTGTGIVFDYDGQTAA